MSQVFAVELEGVSDDDIGFPSPNEKMTFESPLLSAGIWDKIAANAYSHT
jgi:hypothetical protein